MEPLGLALALALIFLALAVAAAWGARYVQRSLERWRRQEPPPTLGGVQQEPVEPALAEIVQQFRRPHLVQTISLAVATALIVVSLVALFLAEGWILFTVLMVIAEIVLITTRGIPLLLSASETLTISDQEIRLRALLGDSAIDWWEVQRVVVEEDLSRFRAEGIRKRVTIDTSTFPSDAKATIYKTLRSHMVRQRQDLSAWPQEGRLYRFSKSAALTLVALIALSIVGVVWGPEPDEAPCYGSKLGDCLQPMSDLDMAHDSCDGDGKRVCLVPLGQVSEQLLGGLIDYYHAEYDLAIRVLTPQELPLKLVEPTRLQIDTKDLIRHMSNQFPGPYNDPDVVLIGLAAVDLYDRDSHYRFLFGSRNPASGRGVVSTFRMNPETFGEARDDDLLNSRARKLITKYIGILHFGLPESHDPRSPLYDSILAISDLDRMREGALALGVRYLIVRESADSDVEAAGSPEIETVRFVERRSPTPRGSNFLSKDLLELWAYFRFDNAAGVRIIGWEWNQNLTSPGLATDAWPGANKGEAWIRLENRLPGEKSQNELTILFDGQPVGTTTVFLRDDLFLGPATFYKDSAGSRLAVFYAGDPNPVYASLEYGSIPGDSSLAWLADQDGKRIGEGSLTLTEEEGRVLVPIQLPQNPNAGLIQIYFYVSAISDEPLRTAWLVVASPDVARAPPFEYLEFGFQPDLKGHLEISTKILPATVSRFDYVLAGIDLAHDSLLELRWYRQGRPLGSPGFDTYSGSDGIRLAYGIFPGREIQAGEYQVLATLDGVPVYADVFLVE